MDGMISEIYIYPVKSCHGILVREAELTKIGFTYDRRWMVVDPKGNFLSQRKFPRMALIQPMLEKNELVLAAPGQKDFILPIAAIRGEVKAVRIHKDWCLAFDQGEDASGWLTSFLQTPCRLVHQSFFMRLHDSSTLKRNIEVAFQDGYPLLIISQASLDDLNRRLTTPIKMDRFRPNIVVWDTQPYEEDQWRTITIGASEITLKNVKPCVRCAIIATDQNTGTRNKKTVEPLTVLETYRRLGKGQGVIFGSNFIALSEGIIHLNDKVYTW